MTYTPPNQPPKPAEVQEVEDAMRASAKAAGNDPDDRVWTYFENGEWAVCDNFDVIGHLIYNVETRTWMFRMWDTERPIATQEQAVESARIFFTG
jgi:hypothetical protein